MKCEVFIVVSEGRMENKISFLEALFLEFPHRRIAIFNLQISARSGLTHSPPSGGTSEERGGEPDSGSRQQGNKRGTGPRNEGSLRSL